MGQNVQANADIGPVATLLVSLMIGAMGIGMFLTPDANIGLDVGRERLGLKQIVVWMWSRPVGVVLVMASTLIVAGVIAVRREMSQ